MDESPPPSNGSALENALKQIQAWFVNGEFEKVKQGCEEVLRIAPSNSIAQDLLKKTTEAITSATPAPAAPQINEETPGVPAEPEPPMPEVIAPPPGSTPAEVPMPDGIIEMPTPSMNNEDNEDDHDYDLKKSILFKLAILLGVFVIGFGGVVAYKTFFSKKSEEPPSVVIEDTQDSEGTDSTQDNIEIPTDYDGGNDEASVSDVPPGYVENANTQRSEDLSLIENALIRHYEKFKKYPGVDEIQTALVENNFLSAMPTPPETDEVYIYAVYSNSLGPNQIFVLSAEFDEDDGSKAIWSTGGNTLQYSDYRNVAAAHVTIIHSTMTEAEYLQNQPQVETSQPSEPPRQRVPRT